MIGHDKQLKYFKNLIKNESLSHAYLFSGPEMIGKRLFALDLYELINKRNYQNDPDFRLIAPNILEDEHKIYIEDIRSVKSFFSLKPYFGPHKVCIIDNAHKLTPEASNALLKLLEEPPSFSLIILVSSLPRLMPATILSRCEEIRFMPTNDTLVSEYLSGQKKLNKDDKDFIAKLSGGRIGLVSSLLDQNNLTNAKKYVDDLRKMLKAGIYDRMEYAKKAHESEKYQEIVDYWISWVGAHVKVSPKNEKIVKDLLFLSNIISQPQYNHRLALESFLLNL